VAYLCLVRSYAARHFHLLAAITLAGAQSIPLGVERSRNLGYGFHRDIIAEAAPPNAQVFESVGHFEYLFYQEQKLAALNSCECLLAPDGHAIVYQDGHSGNIFMFERDSGKAIQLTEKFPGLAMKMKWAAPDRISAFVVPSSRSPESSGKWITLAIPKT
jgi:hypothetical protein